MRLIGGVEMNRSHSKALQYGTINTAYYELKPLLCISFAAGALITHPSISAAKAFALLLIACGFLIYYARARNRGLL